MAATRVQFSHGLRNSMLVPLLVGWWVDPAACYPRVAGGGVCCYTRNQTISQLQTGDTSWTSLNSHTVRLPAGQHSSPTSAQSTPHTAGWSGRERLSSFAATSNCARTRTCTSRPRSTTAKSAAPQSTLRSDRSSTQTQTPATRASSDCHLAQSLRPLPASTTPTGAWTR